MPALTDYDLACAASRSYTAPATVETPRVHALIERSDDNDIVSFRGSADSIAWFRDFDALPVRKTIEHVDLGVTHLAFADDVEEIFDAICAKLTGRVHIGGHSKGGGEGQIFAALLTVRHPEFEIIRLTTFGAPRVGLLNGIIAGKPGNDFHNHGDPVPGVPCYLDHPRPVEEMAVVPAARDTLGPLAPHRLLYYIEGARSYE